MISICPTIPSYQIFSELPGAKVPHHPLLPLGEAWTVAWIRRPPLQHQGLVWYFDLQKGSSEFKMTQSITTRSRTVEWRLRAPTSLSTISSLWFTTIRLDLQNVVKLATGKILPFLYQSYLIYFISIWLASCPCCSPCPRSWERQRVVTTSPPLQGWQEVCIYIKF